MIEDYRNKYSGKTVFVVGNGPSLNVLPITKLSEYYTLAVNNFLPYGIEKFSLVPTFWASSYGGDFTRHTKYLTDYKSSLTSNNMRLVLPEDYLSLIREGWQPPVSPVPNQLSSPNRIRELAEAFQQTEMETIVVPVNLLPPRFFGLGVITHLAIPFCCYAGFKKIVLVGMDLGGWNEFYAVRPRAGLKKMRFSEYGICWDGERRSNFDAVTSITHSIFARAIPEYNKLMPPDVKFYHTTPRAKHLNTRERIMTTLRLSEESKTGFYDSGDGFYVHKLEDLVSYIDFNDALRLADKKD